jgi:hypothetical protein
MNRLSWIVLFFAASFFANVAPSPAQFIPQRPPKYEHFMLGVYVCSAETVLTVPMEKVFSDFLTHGIEIISVNAYNYYPLASEKKFNQYAKSNGVQILLQLCIPELIDANYTDDYLRKYVKGQIDTLNKLPDSNAVKGWTISDEIEDPFLSGDNRDQRRLNFQTLLQRTVKIVHELDPSRRAVTNHDALPWMTIYEDEPYCSTGFTTRLNAYKVKDRIAEARKQGYQSYFLVSQASTCPRGTANLRWYGYHEPITDRVLDSFTLAREIQDQAEVAYQQGATGAMYFLYWAGGANYLPYTLTDINGDDYLGKWDAVLKAARNIRDWEGAPRCGITSPENKSWLTMGKPDKNASWIVESLNVTVSAKSPEGDPVKSVECQYSADGCLTWKPLKSGAKQDEFMLKPADLPPGQVQCRIRARAFNSKGPSLWDMIETKISVAQ